MARPTSISQEQILEAARKVFLEGGYQASTATIAKEAGISEGSIFKRFNTKAQLFRAAMELPEPPSLAQLRELADEGDVRQLLESTCLRLIDFFKELLPRVMMMWAQADRACTPLHMMRGGEAAGDRPLPQYVLQAVTAVLDQQMEAGRLRQADPEILARMLVASCHNYVFFEVIGIEPRMPISKQSYVRALVDMLLKGVCPEENP